MTTFLAMCELLMVGLSLILASILWMIAHSLATSMSALTTAAAVAPPPLFLPAPVKLTCWGVYYTKQKKYFVTCFFGASNTKLGLHLKNRAACAVKKLETG